ncbi:hypothetical protein [Streptomyces spectabilis]|uniref:UL36 very large tegument protein n=1 Tax=Streptomyces spectabilis TaxID=68270 RepID=A0A516RFS8_STRST|nr:hypothetical protein [Streptomyces spectabilis]QDQ14509.1 hypothetical protein FH965_31390 [Streptomyces spectabilis]
MAVGQLPEQVTEFARYLNELLARLDQRSGWCGVFWSRDPDGMRACLDGTEVPPWDVVQALLHDLAADVGVGIAQAETGRARALHAASVAAHDDRPGGREVLSDRLDMMLQEQRFAVEREQELARSLALAATGDEVDRIHLDLAWVRDDHERAAARCGELRRRMERLDQARAPRWVDFGGTPSEDGEFPADTSGRAPAKAPGAPDDVPPDTADDVWRGTYDDSRAETYGGRAEAYDSRAETYDSRTEAYGSSAEAYDGPVETYDGRPAAHGADGRDTAYGHPQSPEDPDPPLRDAEPEPGQDAVPRVPAQSGRSRLGVRRRPRGARFAGLDATGVSDGAGPAAAPGADPAPRTPRGARYVQAVDAPARAHPAPSVDEDGAAADERATVDAVDALIRLRGEGRSGEAHGVLVEAAGWPAARLPLFAEELHHAGLAADWATLLWEAASLPPDRLVAVADALAGAGRADDCRKLLRQGVARPAPEIAESLLALIEAGREREARALLDAYVRVRSAEHVAACAHTDPQRLIPLLLEMAKGVSDAHHWDLVHALRVAGFTT